MTQDYFKVQYTQITPILPYSSHLAFGCGGIAGRVGKKQSLRVLRLAFDYGITHFDVARSYGYGEAESCVGEALKHCREKVIITTKFGLLPANSAYFLRKLKPALQGLLKTFPHLRPLLSKSSNIIKATAVSQLFTPSNAKASLEKSLVELKTDYIDILFLHDCLQEDLTEEIIDFLDSQIKQGKIRAYGAATSIDAVREIERQHPQCILQFPNNIIHRNAQKLLNKKKVFLTYSPFFNIHKIKLLLAKQKVLQSFDLPIKEADIYELMLSYARNANRQGVIITSMLNDQHLQHNLRIVETPKYNEAQVNNFVDFIASTIKELPED